MGKQKADYLLRSDHIFTSTVENPFAGYVAEKGNPPRIWYSADRISWRLEQMMEVIGLTNRQRFWNWEISW